MNNLNNKIALESNEILNIYAKNSGVIMRGLIAENKDLIEEVKYYISEGWDKAYAIDFVIDEFSFKLNSNESKLLKDWMLNKMK